MIPFLDVGAINEQVRQELEVSGQRVMRSGVFILGGELEALERAWREAEEIAGIADAMFVPAAVDAEVERLKLRRTHESNAAPPASER